MTTTERGFDTGSTSEPEGNTPADFEEISRDEPWAKSFSVEALFARGLAEHTFHNIRKAQAEQEARRKAQSEAGGAAGALALRRLASEQADLPPSHN